MSVPARAPVPHDPDIEAALIGAALVYPSYLEGVADDLAAEDFYVPRHQALWTALLDLIEAGVTPEPLLMVDRARRHGAQIEAGDVVGIMNASVRPQRGHVEIILRHAASRRVLGTLAEVRSALDDGSDPFAVAAQGARDLDAAALSAARDEPEAMTLPDLIAGAEEAAPWVIPGLLRQDWRAVIVAPEGVGKSTLLRQIALCAAQGIHPLRFEPIAPVATLVVDAENPRAAIAETGVGLDAQARRSAGATYDASRCLVWSRPGGLDLRDPKDRAAFVRELRASRPGLVVAGPVYKLGRRRERESYEDAAEGVLAVLDDLRTRFGFALVLEHHAPKSQGGYRDLVPFGSQRWLAWPELGLSLRAEKDGSGLRVGRFRGDRLHCSWPDRLVRSNPWPWAGVWEHGGAGRDGDF